LRDVFHEGSGVVEQQKLVHLYPDSLCWVCKHLIGSNKYSQFTYEISAEGKAVRA